MNSSLIKPDMKSVLWLLAGVVVVPKVVRMVKR
jgi:hypothetical protein